MSRFNAGDRVRAIGNVSGFEGPGTVLEVDEGHPTNEYLVRFDSRPGNRIWAENDSVRPLLVASIHITTDGKTTHAVLKEGGKVTKRAKAVCSPYDEFDFATGARIAFDRLVGNPVDVSPGTVREVKRPAKVGDWVKFIKNHGGYLAPGSIHRVECERDGTLFFPGGFMGYVCSDHDKYVVLEGYTPEKPKYYNGKVVCVKCLDSDFTIGKVYEFEDGEVKDNKGKKRPVTGKIKELDEYSGRFYRFIEFKGEA